MQFLTSPALSKDMRRYKITIPTDGLCRDLLFEAVLGRVDDLKIDPYFFEMTVESSDEYDC